MPGTLLGEEDGSAANGSLIDSVIERAAAVGVVDLSRMMPANIAAIADNTTAGNAGLDVERAAGGIEGPDRLAAKIDVGYGLPGLGLRNQRTETEEEPSEAHKPDTHPSFLLQ